MGQSVVCPCGQRNNLDSYRYGEPRLCVACGRPLSPPPVVLAPEPSEAFKEESFTPEFKSIQPASGAPGASFVTGFETPSEAEAEASPAIPAPAPRAWEGGVRETLRSESDGLRCAKCQRPFRGDWDKHERPGGLFCHICATQADPNYQPPDLETRRELFRPAPPKKIEPRKLEDDSEEQERRRKKKLEVTAFAVIAVGTLVFVNLFPVEEWAAIFFTSDLSKIEGVSFFWVALLYVSKFVIGAIGHMAALFFALYMSRLLHPGGRENNLGPIIFLGIAFEVLNTILAVMSVMFTFFGPLALVLIGIAFVVMVTMKFLLVSNQFHIGFEGFVSFFISWIMASMLLKPGVYALLKLVQGIVAAIAL